MGRLSKLTDFQVHFWGVRGSIACPGTENTRYGGNTSCVEIRCGEKLLIFDAGTGIRNLAKKLVSSDNLELDLFLTHTHFDHVSGFPFFSPVYRTDTKLQIWSGHLLPDRKIEQVLGSVMMDPLWPVQLEDLVADIQFNDFSAGDTLEPTKEIRIRTAKLNHPNGATGYRIEYGGRSICYVTDTEHLPDRLDETVIELVKDADILIYDCMYTDDEYPNHVNWGHSTWQEGVKLANHALVKQFVAFHHEPDHDDRMMDSIAEALFEARPDSLVAREGMTLCV